MIVYNAQFIAEARIGDSLTAGILVSVFSIAGALASYAFKHLYKIMRNWLLPLSFATASVGLLLGFVGSVPQSGNLMIYALGIALAGVALMIITCYTPVALSTVTPSQHITLVMGLVSFAMAAGTFLSTPFAQVVNIITQQSDIRILLLVAMVVALAVGVMVTVMLIGRNSREVFEPGSGLVQGKEDLEG
jgi:hypothetical protein